MDSWAEETTAGTGRKSEKATDGGAAATDARYCLTNVHEKELLELIGLKPSQHNF